MSKIGALLTMPKILDPIFLTIRKNRNPKLKYVATKWLICLKNGPKVLGNIGHWDPFLTGTPYFRCSLCSCVNYLTRIDLHGEYKATKKVIKMLITECWGKTNYKKATSKFFKNPSLGCKGNLLREKIN